MLLTITSTHRPATDLGYLLHKNPTRLQSLDLTFGRAHVFYPEASDERCTAALLLDVDPVQLVRGGRAGGDGAFDQYVNDRPYVASSFLSVAIGEAFGTAMAGRSRERAELAEMALPLRAMLAVVPCRGGEEFLKRLFEPLGYRVSATRHPLDEAFPAWGPSTYFSVELEGIVRLRDLLNHLYVLVPVLDDDKHYFVGEAEVDKLLRRGEGWLAGHPEREAITRRYLFHRRSLVQAALDRLVVDEGADPDVAEEVHAEQEATLERRLSLGEQRIAAVLSVLKDSAAKRVLDLGCGEGRLLKELVRDASFEEVVGFDVSHRALERASAALRLERLPDRLRERVKLLHGSLVYRDRRLDGYDAAVALEVVEHLDLPRLGAFERVLFERASPSLIVITTPNSEYNTRFERLPAGRFRHADHRFEWTRVEFENWAKDVAARFGYSVRFVPVGPEDSALGAPTQMGIFKRGAGMAA